MKKILGMSAAVMAILFLTASISEACHCGARRHRCCSCETSCAPAVEYQTVMKTCTRVVYETEQYTAYRNCCVPVQEQRVVEAVRYIPETHYRTCTQTVNRPVYETTMNTVSYTVCRPVYETQTRQVQTTVCRPVYETAQREERYTVCRPETYTKKIQVCSGHWETRAAPVSACAPETCAPAQACAPVQQCRVWVPEMQEKEIQCTRMVPETKTRMVPYTTCRMVSEVQTRNCNYTVCHLVQEQRTRQVPVTTCHMVSEQRNYQVPYTVCRAEKYQQTIPCVRYETKQVPYTATRCVAKTITEQVPVKVCVPVPSCGS